MRRLYLQIYLTFVGILLLFAVSMSALWWTVNDAGDDRRSLDNIAALIAEVLPAPGAAPGELQFGIERLAALYPARVTVRASDGTLLAHVGEALPAVEAGFAGSRLVRVPGIGPVLTLHLPDGRWVLARRLHRPRPFGWIAGLTLLALSIAVGAYPVVRRITRRLERLQARVDALGAGELSARVQVEGKDEVAELARSFNRAAERIEGLVAAQRQMLAAASHELRSPLTRMRMALELLQQQDRPDLRARLATDIAELDELIGEILLASRLEVLDRLDREEPVDLLALLAEEASRTGAAASGDVVTVIGDPRLLQRMMRNLLENAQRYAGGTEVEAAVTRSGERSALLSVEDRGAGVPDDERSRIFEPFYRARGSRETGEGVGLGLALVSQIARRHGGSARCVAREGGGTRFEIALPIAT